MHFRKNLISFGKVWNGGKTGGKKENLWIVTTVQVRSEIHLNESSRGGGEERND